MASEAFVYCWSNLTNGAIYVGYHKGQLDDGYVCSSKSERFWNDYNNVDMQWSREVLAEGLMEDMVAYELAILKSLDLKRTYVYNNNAGGGVVFTDEVRAKISKANKGKPSSMLGKKHSLETRAKMSADRKGRKFTSEHCINISNGNKGLKRSEASRLKMSKAKSGLYLGVENPNWGKTTYEVISPNGEVTVIGGGFTRWCKDRGLSQTALRNVALGKTKQHKGYTAVILETRGD